MPSILFVCLGNICRSPTAEAVFKARAAGNGLQLYVDSAGTSGWHAGEAPDHRAIEAGISRGYDFTGQASRMVERSDFASFDYILAMDRKNLRDLQALRPDGYGGELALFLDYAPQTGLTDVPDPYYGGGSGFDQVLDLIEAASDGLIAALGANP